MMFQGVEDLCAPRFNLLFVSLKEFGRKGVDVLAGVIEVESSDRALFESVFKDIPQPYSTVRPCCLLSRLSCNRLCNRFRYSSRISTSS
jgi:hypothetical protein